MEEESCHNTSETSSSCSKLQTEEANYHEDSNEHIQHNHWNNQQEQLNSMPRINISITKPFMIFMLDDVWSCIVVQVLFWLIVGVDGSANLQLGPYSSHLIEINSVLIQSIKVEQNNKPKPGLMLYGFDNPPPLDVKINWTEIYDESIPAKSQKACRERLIEWKKDPSFPNSLIPLLFKNCVQLKIDYLLTTPGPRKGVSNHEWFDVNVSYEPRWIIYFAGSGVVIVQILFALKFYKMLHTNNEENTGFQQMEVISERTPLISRKDSDLPSWSSAYDSFSSENSDEGKSIIEGETNRDCIFLPCGHFATCFACGKRVAEETCTCPICRRKLKKLRRIYVV
ncbi:RING/U-box superfamily protein [Trifolium repens]|nr:RING/U-box superfamily protein [Trifolium repens]